MATDFDSMIGGGASMASGFAGLAAMFSGMQQQRAQGEQNVLARLSQNQNFMQQQRLMDRQMLLQESQLRSQAQQQAQELGIRRQESAFEQLNRTLTLQMQMQEKEAANRDRAFAMSQQAILNDMQTKSQMMQLRAFELTQRAADARGDIMDLTAQLAVDMENGNDAAIAATQKKLEDHVRSPYYNYFDKEMQGQVFNTLFTSKRHTAKVTSLDPENLTKNYTLAETIPEISDALRGKSVTPKQLQFMTYLKQFAIDAGTLSDSDAEITPEDVERMIPMLEGRFSETNAKTITGWLQSEKNRTKLADQLTKLPSRPLTTEQTQKFYASTRQLDQIEREMDAGLFAGSERDKALFREALNAQRAAAFYSAAGEGIPELALKNFETNDPKKIERQYMEYSVDDINTPADQARWSDRAYFKVQSRRTSSTGKYESSPVTYRSEEFFKALSNGTLYYDPTRSMVDPDTGKREGVGLIPRLKKVEFPVDAKRAARIIGEAQDRLQTTLTPGTAGMLNQTPDGIFASVFASHEQALKAIDLQMRNGQAGSEAYLDMGRMFPRSSVVKIDLIARSLQREGIPMLDVDGNYNPAYRRAFIDRVENFNLLDMYYQFRVDPRTGQMQQGMMGSTGQMSQGAIQQPSPAGGGNLPWMSGTGSPNP